MSKMAERPARVKGEAAPASGDEDELLAACAAVFGDGEAISLSPAERHVAAAREALARHRTVLSGGATDWRAEALRELACASAALDAISVAELGRVLRAVVAGLRDDIAELNAVLAGDR